jgi:Uma2 family endonuclease
MTTATASTLPQGQTFLLEDVSWDYYTRTLQEMERQKRHVRVTYDRGRMEFMTFTVLHEFVRRTLGRFVETYSLERGVRATSLGSFTCRRSDLDRGLEPDECYYVHSAPPPAEPQEIDPSIHPVPDLAIEVDITHSSLPRQSIYAALGVQEIWRYSKEHVTFLRRLPNGTYVSIEKSDVFPELTGERIGHFLGLALPNQQYDAVVAFRDWLRSPRS